MSSAWLGLRRAQNLRRGGGFPPASRPREEQLGEPAEIGDAYALVGRMRRLDRRGPAMITGWPAT